MVISLWLTDRLRGPRDGMPPVTLVRIVADDLTGALDTAAPLAALAGPLPVFWGWRQAARARRGFALDTETRDAPADPAATPWWHHFAGAGLAYKKIDSLLRGRTTVEIAECLASGKFASAVIAPAFPTQQRITREGRQYWRKTADEEWRPVECDLAQDLQRRGVPLTVLRSAERVLGQGFFVCDAESEADLAAIAAAGARLTPPVLWCGSAGLARALAASAESAPAHPPPAPVLMLIGSHHPVTLAQVEALRGHDRDLICHADPTDPEGLAAALRRIAARLKAGARCAALLFALPDGTGRAIAAPAYRRLFECLARDLPPPRSLFVTGGATLFHLVQALGARSLLVSGELTPGIPCSSLEGGSWSGVQIVSKSGAFGTPDLLIRLAESAMP